ncbi:hypothetical protein AB3S75_009115 [Citrus x aurantiifolia]
MSQNSNKVETVVEVRAPAAKFHQVFSCKPHILASMSPQSIQGCDLLEGEWGKPGCIICWRYFHDGSPQIAKEIMEVIDNENYITNYKVIEGNLLELYKSFCSTVKVTPTLLEKWATMTENICHPTLFMTEFLSVIVAPLTNL